MSKTPRRTPDAAANAPRNEALDPDIAALGFEEAVEELEAIIQRMERGETGLEESLLEYARGDQLIRRCRQVLDAAEARIQAISGRDLEAGRDPGDAPPA
jgi:exodeoxyribonuclease VII small subunit